jgi:hypothetical protein
VQRELRGRMGEMSQMINLTHTEHGHNGPVLPDFGCVECRLSLRRVWNYLGKSELSPVR